MGFWLIALFIVSIIGSIALAPKPEFENARPGKLGDIKFPKADEGSPVTVIFGKVRLRAPNVLWYGDFFASPITKNQSTGWFSSEDVIVGYAYYIGFDLGLCVGPDVKLKTIWCEKKILWQTPVGVGTGSITLAKPNLFGGYSRGGGMRGTAYLYGGEFDQVQDSYLQEKLGDDIPAYRGIAHIVFHRIYIGTAPQIRTLSFEVMRYPDNLGLDEAVRIIGDDLNPMEALYSALTESWGGLNTNPTDIDTDSFVTAAEILATEGNGISFSVQNVNTGQSIIEEILRQADGLLYQDPITGKMYIKLIREDYVLSELPVFDESNVLVVDSFSRTSWAETYNQVRVKFAYRSKKYMESTALAQDSANINMQGRVRSVTYSYPGIATPSQAVNIASRDLAFHSVPLLQASLHLTRLATSLRPGSPFKLTWAEYGLNEVVFRVQKFDFSELLNGRVVADIVQDKFAAINALFLGPEDTQWEAVERPAVEVIEYLVCESPYWFTMQVHNLVMPANSTWIWYIAFSADNYQLHYDVYSSNDNFVTDTVNDLDQRHYPPCARLVDSIDSLLSLQYGIIPEVSITGHYPGGNWLSAASVTQLHAGNNLFMIDNEIFGYEDSYWNTFTGEMTLLNVHRALLDTKFESHAANARLVFFGARGGSFNATGATNWLGRTPRGNAAQLWWRFLSYTDQDAQDLGDCVNHTITANNRWGRPLPPDNTAIQSYRIPTDLVLTTSALDVSNWYTRNRVTPDNVVLLVDSQDAPETGTTYKVDLYVNNRLVYTGTAAAGSHSKTIVGRGAGLARVEVFAALGSGTIFSWTPDWVEFWYAVYLNLCAELVTNGTFESSDTTGWTVHSGSWARTATAYPLTVVLPGTYHIQSTNANSVLSQTITITGYEGKAGVVRLLRGGLNLTNTSQLVVELLGAADVVLDSVTTTLMAPRTVGRWDLIEVPLPIRSDAVKVHLHLIATQAGAALERASLRINTVSTTSATAYDALTGITVKSAWGLRKLISTYSGPLVRIRDTYDNAETDLYADIDGNLEPYFTIDEARVVKLYDQSGNSVDLTPESVAEQPRLIPMVSATGRPAIDFDSDVCSLVDPTPGTTRPYMVTRPNCSLVIGPKWNVSSNCWIAGVTHKDTLHETPYYRFGLRCGTTNWTYHYNASDTSITGAGSSSVVQSVWWLDYYNGAVYHNEDVTAKSTFSAVDITYPNSTRLRFAESPTGIQNWEGYFFELCVFEGNISAANRKTMMEALGLYWHNLAV